MRSTTPHSHFVLQRWIEPHPDIEQLFPGYPATVRITTVNHGGTVRVVNQYLRAGKPGEAWIRSATHVVLPLDRGGGLLETGMDVDWQPLDRHPVTGGRLLGKSVRGFDRMATSCVELHDRIPHFMIIGWDVIIDPDDRVVIFEWNTEWPGIKRDEATVGPIFQGLGLERMRSEG